MSVAILLITHGQVGHALMDTATMTFGRCPLSAANLPIHRHDDRDQCIATARRMADELDEGDGVLVLTDMYGSTPSNVAIALLDDEKRRVVAGLNLPMFIKVMNYPRLKLDELVDKAVQGGREGVSAWCDAKDNC